MDFPRIIDFDEVDTMPSNLMDLADERVLDVKSGPLRFTIRRDPRDVLATFYPRVLAQIDLLWGTQELQDKFVQWLLIDQEGRRGWSSVVSSALIELEDEHARKFGLEGTQKWDCRPDRW